MTKFATRNGTTSQITSLTIVCSAFYSGADQRQHQSSVSLAFVRGIHWSPVNSPHKGPVTWKMIQFDDAIMMPPALPLCPPPQPLPCPYALPPQPMPLCSTPKHYRYAPLPCPHAPLPHPHSPHLSMRGDLKYHEPFTNVWELQLKPIFPHIIKYPSQNFSKIVCFGIFGKKIKPSNLCWKFLTHYWHTVAHFNIKIPSHLNKEFVYNHNQDHLLFMIEIPFPWKVILYQYKSLVLELPPLFAIIDVSTIAAD